MNVKDIMKIMDSISYGFKDKNGNDVSEKDFASLYYLQTPEELLQSKCGVCWDQVELERALFLKANMNIKTYFIFMVINDKLPSHTFLTYKENDKYYWFEHSWQSHKGIHEYDSEPLMLKDIKSLFIKEYGQNYDSLYLYEYQKPLKHLTSDEFYKYIETQKKIDI